MKKRVKPSKGRGDSSKSAKRKGPAASKAGRKPKAAVVKPKRKPVPGKRKPAPPKRKPAPARPKPKPAPVVMKPKRMPAVTKGPSVTALQQRVQGLEEQLKAREHDRVELERWRQHHSQLQEQAKAKDSALAFKERELLDLRRQVEELKAELKRKETSA